MKYSEAKRLLESAFLNDCVEQVKMVEEEFCPEYVLDAWANFSDFTIGSANINKVRDYLGPKSPEYQEFLRMNVLSGDKLDELVCDLESSIASILDDNYAEDKSKEGMEAYEISKTINIGKGWKDTTIKNSSSQKGFYLSIDDPETKDRYALAFKFNFVKTSKAT